MRRRTITIADPQRRHCSLGRWLNAGRTGGGMPGVLGAIARGLSPMRNSVSRWRVLLEWLSSRDRVLYVFVVMALSTGARRAQLLGLRWESVDLERNRVAFVAGWVEGSDGPVLAATKTGRRHQVQIDPVTTALLERLGDGAGVRGSCSAMTMA